MDERGWQRAAWAIAAIAIVVIGIRVLNGSGAEPAPVKIEPASEPRVGNSPPTLYVHVAGAVRRPGLYRVVTDARVAAAVDRAGGPTRAADLSAVNLAATVSDGQQIFVPAQGDSTAASTGRAPLSLGSATAEELEELDGIGPTLAERIIEQRQATGGFSSLDELDDVEGIGTQRLEALKEALAP
jgi:competence protein ComEA